MLRLLMVVFSLTLVSCTSIPLSTMLEFRSFGQEEFLELQPEHIVAKIQIDDPVRADVSQTQLAVMLSTEQNVRSYQFPLVLISEEHIESEAGWFSRKSAKNQYTFKLADEAVQNFRSVQDDVQLNEPTDFKFTVSSSMEELPEHIDEIRLSLFLKLSESSEFITMFRNAKLKVNWSE